MSLFQRFLCTEMLFQFLKYTMLLLSVYCDIFHFPLILIYTEEYILFTETWKSKRKREGIVVLIVQFSALSLWTQGHIQHRILGGNIFLGWVLEMEEDWTFSSDYTATETQILQHPRCFRNCFFCCQVTHLKQRCSKTTKCFILTS